MTATPDFRALLADDAYAASFQSLGQYRTALLKALATTSTTPDFRALCAKALHFLEPINTVGTLILTDEIKAALAEQPVGLSPREVEAQDAFTRLRDEILNLSDGLEVNEVLGIIDNYTPEWV
jgi:hypothetical protein